MPSIAGTYRLSWLRLANESEEPGTGYFSSRLTHFAFRETVTPRIRAAGKGKNETSYRTGPCPVSGHQIIIDSPPILSTPDPLVIARHVDGVLLVVRAGKTPRDYLTKALQSV